MLSAKVHITFGRGIHVTFGRGIHVIFGRGIHVTFGRGGGRGQEQEGTSGVSMGKNTANGMQQA